MDVSLFLFIFELLAKIPHIHNTLISSIIQMVNQFEDEIPRIVDIISNIIILLFLQL